MAVNFGRRFDELLQQADHIEANKVRETGPYAMGEYSVDWNMLLGWRAKARQLLTTVCGSDSPHLVLFSENEKGGFTTSYGLITRLKSIVAAAKEDYEGGYLNKLRNLIQADVFDNELEQAEELFGAGYHTAAAVIAGVVLETTLRQMCEDIGIQAGNLNKMSADLTRAEVLNKLQQKQITSLANIRNSAAHGKTDEFRANDVETMIRDVRRFLGDQLS